MELLNLNDALKKLESSTNTNNSIQDTIWYITMNVNKFSHEEISRILITLKNYIQYCEPYDALLIGNNLKPAYFEIMNEEEKGIYIDMLLQVKEKNNRAFWGDFFELTSKIYKDAPENKQNDLFDFIFENIDKSSTYPVVVCAICFSLRRIYSKLEKEKQDNVKDKLLQLKKDNEIDYIKLIIDENLNSMVDS